MGEKTIVEVYQDNHGESSVRVTELNPRPGHRVKAVILPGIIRTVKVHCHDCGETYLDRATYPDTYTND
jgi:hypothetical protein